MLLTTGAQVREPLREVNQAAVFARPREEVAFLASAENFSAAERSSSSWRRSRGKVARGCVERAFRISFGSVR